MPISRACILLAVVAIAGSAATQAQAAGNIARGRATAVQDCSACHKVTAAQFQPAAVMDKESGLTVVAPSFAAIGLKYAGNAQGLKAFVHLPQYPMPEQQLSPADLDDIAAYIESLHSRP